MSGGGEHVGASCDTRTKRSSSAHIVEICTFPRCCPRSRSMTTVFCLSHNGRRAVDITSEQGRDFTRSGEAGAAPQLALRGTRECRKSSVVMPTAHLVMGFQCVIVVSLVRYTSADHRQADLLSGRASSPIATHGIARTQT